MKNSYRVFKKFESLIFQGLFLKNTCQKAEICLSEQYCLMMFVN